jgi:hypothetical protein
MFTVLAEHTSMLCMCMQVLKRMLQGECSELKMVSDGQQAVTEFNKVKL